MQFPSTKWVFITGVVLLALAALVFWIYAKPALPVDTDSLVATTTPDVLAGVASSSPVVTVAKFALQPGDVVSSWSFKGAYTGNETLVAQANADIASLTNLIGKGQYDDYDLYNGIGNDYNLLGDGASAYRYYNRAVAVHADKGLAYMNLAHLFDELGAKQTAVAAYAKAVAVEPAVLQFHTARLTYLTQQFPGDTVRITAALTDASKQFGDTPAVLAVEAEWLAGQKRYADAIKAWETVKMLSPESRQTAIDAEIARLKAKQ